MTPYSKLKFPLLAAAALAALGLANCSVDQSKYVFDDDEYAKLENERNGSGADGNTGGNGSGADGSGADGSGAMSMGGSGPVGECTAGMLRCGESENAEEDIAQAYVCAMTDDGSAWLASGAACEFVCDAGGCTGVCEPGDSRCISDVKVEICNDRGQWEESDCGDQACVGTACMGECRPATSRCNTGATAVERCDTSGDWQTQQTCDGTCQDALCTGNCTNGETQCTTSGSGDPLLLTCAGNDWGTATETTCQYVCGPDAQNGGADGCVGECDPGAKECSGSGVRTCGSDGLWSTPVSCSHGCNSQTATCNECTPGSRECVTGGATVCGSDGKWEKPVACSGESSCFDGYCELCPPKTQRCSDGIIENCDGNPGKYQWVEKENCGETKHGPNGEPGRCGLYRSELVCLYRACDYMTSVTFQKMEQIDAETCTADKPAEACNHDTGICVSATKCPARSHGCLSSTYEWTCSLEGQLKSTKCGSLESCRNSTGACGIGK